MAKKRVGVVFESAPQHWQVLQQDKTGQAVVELGGRWFCDEKIENPQVVLRVLHESTYEPVTRELARVNAIMGQGDIWSLRLRIPTGGLYRIESALQVGGQAIEWARRGDMVHHLGVGDVWVIAGQSNSAGYGKSPADDGPHLGVHCFYARGQWSLATHPLGDSTNSKYPANRETANASHSPYLAFGKRLQRELGYPIGLIPTALGGSPLQAWDRKDGSGHLFDNMVEYLRDALAGNVITGPRVRGMCWYQGESDAGPEARKTYIRRFRAFVSDFRKHVRDSKCAVLTCQLNRFVGAPLGGANHPHWEAMREVQRQAAKRIANVHVVATADLNLSDGIHTDSPGNLVIGRRLAAKALGAVYGRDVKHQHPQPREARITDGPAIEVSFDHVDERLHFESKLETQVPFAVRDRQGRIAITGYQLPAADRIRLELERAPEGKATLVGAPTACPPMQLPVDICGYLPMLGFVMKVERG